MEMPKNCCIVGCTVDSNRCKGLTFHILPKREKYKEWKAMLIAKINRSDASFNPEKAFLCSRHFKETCFVYGQTGQRYLKPDSLPTEFMPVSLVKTPKPQEKPPVIGECPHKPERVAYYSFSEIIIDAKKLVYPWCILQLCEDTLKLGYISSECVPESILFTVVVEKSTFIAHTKVLGKDLCNKNLEHTKLDEFLKYLTSKKLCQGIKNPALQEYAPLSFTGQEIYFRHMTYNFGETPISNSTVRSAACCLISDNTICKHCSSVYILLCCKHEQATVSCHGVINRHAPLHT